MAAKRIRRNHEREAWYLGGIVLCVVVALWVVINPYKMWIRVLVPLVDLGFAAFLFVWMRKTIGIVECPSCGGTMHDVPVVDDKAVLCHFCGKFCISVGNNTVDAPPPGHVAARPAFAAVLPRGEPTWPDECCQCGAPATRKVDVKIATPALLVVKVPHCDAHTAGAVLLRPDDAASFVIVFRRHEAFQRFAEANATPPYQL